MDSELRSAEAALGCIAGSYVGAIADVAGIDLKLGSM
jgi:hypothetical protein